MLSEEELEKLKRDAKIVKKHSRKRNVLPPNKVVALKNKYKRTRKNTRQWIEDMIA